MYFTSTFINFWKIITIHYSLFLGRVLFIAVAIVIDVAIIFILIFLCLWKKISSGESIIGYEQVVPEIKISAPVPHLNHPKYASIQMPQVLVSDGDSGEQTPAELEDKVFNASPCRQNKSRPGSVYSTPLNISLDREPPSDLTVNLHYSQSK